MNTTRFKGDCLPSYYVSTQRKGSGHALPHEEAPVVVASLPDAHIEINQSTAITKQQRSRPKTPTSTRPMRPSLSEQLATIGQQAQSLVNALSREAPASTKLTVPTATMTVGRLECKFPSPVHFEDAVCRYQFLVASRDIAMYMYYRDMTHVTFEQRSWSLKFKIAHALDQFGSDYDHTNPNHYVVIGFASMSDWRRVQSFLLSKLPRHPRPSRHRLLQHSH
ncbi:hypothetical protein ACHHYP_20785 [Achlya hypogyna]|uniref:Uncharacterized protein n=1 Tax=Achlya hypogyna TaxID=1202772 RepID=A0A1V9YA22_ACHHY|nr:hypothetical protein ACHHYP_20785 [Achlya hypogyna]